MQNCTNSDDYRNVCMRITKTLSLPEKCGGNLCKLCAINMHWLHLQTNYYLFPFLLCINNTKVEKQGWPIKIHINPPHRSEVEVLRQGMSLITTVTTQDPDRQTTWQCICVSTSMQIYDLSVSLASSELTLIGS